MRLMLLFPLVFTSCLAHPSSPYYVIQSDGSRLLRYEAGGLGERNYRKEITKPDGMVVGEYGFNDPSGRLHVVKYHSGPQGYVATEDIGFYSGTIGDLQIMNNFKMGEEATEKTFIEDEQDVSKEDSAMEDKNQADKNENDMTKNGVADVEDHHVEEQKGEVKEQQEIKQEQEDKEEGEDKKEEVKQEQEVKEGELKEEQEVKQEQQVQKEGELKEEQEVKQEQQAIKVEKIKEEGEIKKEEVDENNEFTKDDAATEKNEVILESEIKIDEKIKEDDKVKPSVIDDNEATEEKNIKEETKNVENESGDIDPELAMLFPGPIITRRRLSDKQSVIEEDKAKEMGLYSSGPFYSLPEPASFAKWYNQQSPLLTWPYQISEESPSIRGDSNTDIPAGQFVPFSHPWLVEQPGDSQVNTKQESTSHITFPFYNVGFENKEPIDDSSKTSVKYSSSPAFNFHEYQEPVPSVSDVTTKVQTYRYIPGTRYHYPQPAPFVPVLSRNNQYGVKSLTKTSAVFVPGYGVFT